MSEKEINEIIAQGRCPAEVARERGYNIPVDCECNNFDCFKCLEDVINED